MLLSTHLHLRRVINENTSDVSPSQQLRDLQRPKGEDDNRLVLVLFLRICVYVGTILPHIILVLVCLHGFELDIHHSVYEWQSFTDWLFTLYPVLNPMFTIFLRRDFRVARDWLSCSCWLSHTNTSPDEDGDDTVISIDV